MINELKFDGIIGIDDNLVNFISIFLILNIHNGE